MQAVGAVQLDPALVVRVYQLVSDRMVRHGLRHPLIVAKNHLSAPTGKAPTQGWSCKQTHKKADTQERRT